MVRKQKRIRLKLLLLFICAFALSGCGVKEKNAAVKEGMEAVQMLDYDTALQCFEKAMAAGEDLRLLYRGQGLAYMGQTKYEEAAASFEKALSSGSGRPDEMDYDMNYYLATVYAKLGETDKGIAAYQAILAIRPKDKMAYYLRGSLLIASDFDKAKADFDYAIALDTADYNMLTDIYTVMTQNGYKEAGQEYLRTAVTGESKTMTDYERGRMYYYLEDYENAKNFLEKARTSGGVDAVLFLGRTYETLGDYNYAVSVYASFIEKDQTNAEIYNQLGICKNAMGAYEEALTAFQAGMKVEKCSIMQTLQFNEIVTYEYLRDFKKAAVLMQTYLSAYPDDSAAQREYVFLKTR